MIIHFYVHHNYVQLLMVTFYQKIVKELMI